MASVVENNTQKLHILFCIQFLGGSVQFPVKLIFLEHSEKSCSTLWNLSKMSSLQVSLHIAFVHSFVNPLLFMILHRNTRDATCNLLLCHSSSSGENTPSGGRQILQKNDQFSLLQQTKRKRKLFCFCIHPFKVTFVSGHQPSKKK